MRWGGVLPVVAPQTTKPTIQSSTDARAAQGRASADADTGTLPRWWMRTSGGILSGRVISKYRRRARRSARTKSSKQSTRRYMGLLSRSRRAPPKYLNRAAHLARSCGLRQAPQQKTGGGSPEALQ